jgi:molecular chaperone DnaK (HSP70)
MYALGVDLGTTWTAAAVWEEGRAEVLALGNRALAIPSAVLVEGDGTTVVGEAAQQRRASAPESVAVEFKRRFGDSVPLLVGGRRFGADELTAILLGAVLEAVQGRQGGPPDQVVLTVPASWQEYRQDTMAHVAAACGLADDHVTRMPEPVAAAIHYAGLTRVVSGSTVAVYDLGGGTFDATVVRKTETGFEIVGEPRGTDLGGIDMDNVLMAEVAGRTGQEWSTLDRTGPATRRGLVQLKAEVTQAKEVLSSASSTLVPVAVGGYFGEVKVTRAELETQVEPLVARSIDLLQEAVAAAGLALADLDRVLLVGGASRMPLVRRLIEERLAVPVAVDEHPKYAVCLGAAVAAGSRLLGESVDEPQAGDEPAAPVSRPVPLPVPVPVQARSPEGPEAPGAAGKPAAVAITVDLQASGLTESSEVPLRPAVTIQMPRRAAANQSLTIDLGADEDYGIRPGQLVVVITAVVIVALTLLAWVLLAARR